MLSRRKAKGEPKPKGGARPGAGRKSKRNTAIERVLCEAVQLGMSTARACALAKIHPDSFRDWCEEDPKLLERVEAARSRGILKALEQLEELKREGEVKAICWFLEKMDRSAYGNQTAVVGAQQNNFYASGNGKYSPPDEIAEFISRQRERMALARSLRATDPERAREIERVTLDLDTDCMEVEGALDLDGPAPIQAEDGQVEQLPRQQLPGSRSYQGTTGGQTPLG
jgi:hypothetical protein